MTYLRATSACIASQAVNAWSPIDPTNEPQSAAAVSAAYINDDGRLIAAAAHNHCTCCRAVRSLCVPLLTPGRGTFKTLKRGTDSGSLRLG